MIKSYFLNLMDQAKRYSRPKWLMYEDELLLFGILC